MAPSISWPSALSVKPSDNATVAELNEAAVEHIGDVALVVIDIAEQTNPLALNAPIEPERES